MSTWPSGLSEDSQQKVRQLRLGATRGARFSGKERRFPEGQCIKETALRPTAYLSPQTSVVLTVARLRKPLLFRNPISNERRASDTFGQIRRFDRVYEH